jgi:hypothetical protein
MTALALFGGGATLTACGSSGQASQNGTTDQYDPERLKRVHDNLPNLSDPVTNNSRNQSGSEDSGNG